MGTSYVSAHSDGGGEMSDSVDPKGAGGLPTVQDENATSQWTARVRLTRLSRTGLALLALAGSVGCGPGAFGADIPSFDASTDGFASSSPDATSGVDAKHDAAKDAHIPDGSSKLPDGATSLLCGTDASPATLGPSCCTMGDAYCLPSYDVEQSQLPNFASCSLSSGSGGVCVPAKIIAAGSSFAPKTCASIGGSSGVCLSKCLGAVQTNPATPLLSQGTCDSDELCAPCIDPLDGTSTGACDIHPMSCTSDGGSFDASQPDATGIACPYTGPPIIDPTMYGQCSPACGGAHCVPSSLVPAAEQSLLATCATEAGPGYCAPDSVIQTAGEGLPPTCTSIAGSEGRCLSVCIPQVAAEAEALPQDVCASGTLCAPCYNPTASDPTLPTGACNIACDKPANPPTILSCPYTGPALLNPDNFPACTPACGGSHCVPAALVPSTQQSLLATCGTGASAGFCTPDTLSSTGGEAVPPTCTSVAGAEGRCLSTCLPSVASEADVLPQDVCASGTLCAPCYNPASADPTTPTGACSVACDAPKDPPTILTCPYTGPTVVNPDVFPACAPACGGAHCVPSALVPTAQQSLLMTCGSGANAGFCTPDSLTESGGEGVPPTCTSVAGAEGRCLSTCLPSVASEADVLPQDVCAAGTLCAPCYDPSAADPSAPTGACSIACDKPTKPPVILSCPYTGPNVVNPASFPACEPACAGAHCLPTALVPTSQQKMLASCGSGATAGFCTPDPIAASDDNYVPPSCQPFTDPASEGRCTSTCLPAIAAETSELSQTTCAANNVCAPCYDPFTGLSTGACNVACDAPKDPPFKFPLCCSYDGAFQGTCLPKSLVPTAQQSSLEANSCPTDAANPADYLCVPNEYLPNAPVGAVITCTTPLLGAGTCVSDCANQSLGPVISTQGTCPANHLCIACSVAGASTPGCGG